MAQLPSSGISISLVKRTLNSSYQDIGGLCTDESVNMWSRWKPIKSNISTMTLARLKENHYGIILPHEDSTSYTIAQLTSGIYNCLQNDIDPNTLTVWAYNKPTGGASSPYRLGDFRYYQHQAILPFDYQNEDHPITSFSVDRLGNLYEWITSVLQDNQKAGGLLGADIGELYPNYIHYGAMLLDKAYFLEHGSHDSTRSYNGIYFIGVNPDLVEDDEQLLIVRGTPYYFTSSVYLYVPFIAYINPNDVDGDLFEPSGLIPNASNWSDIISKLGKVFPLPDGLQEIQIIGHNEPNPVLIQAGWGRDGMMWAQMKNEPYYNLSTTLVNTVNQQYFQLTDFNLSKIKYTRTDTYTTGPWSMNIDFFVAGDINEGCVWYTEDMDADAYYLKLKLNSSKQLTSFEWNMNGTTSAITLSSPVTLPTTSTTASRIMLESTAQQRMSLKFYLNKSNTTPTITADLGYVYTNNMPDTIVIGTPSANVAGLRDFFITGYELKVSN